KLTTASKSYAMAIRKITTAGKGCAIAITKLTTASKSYVIAIMKLTTAGKGCAIAITKLTTASKRYAMAIRKLMTASKSYAIAIRKLMTGGKGCAIAIMKLMTGGKGGAIAIRKLTTASKGYGVVIHKLATAIAGGGPRGSSAPVTNAKLMTSLVTFTIAGLRRSSALLSLITARMSSPIAGMRLTASARPHWLPHAGLTIPIPSVALLTTKGASRSTSALRRVRRLVDPRRSLLDDGHASNIPVLMGISNKWKATIDGAISNSAWDAYDSLIQSEVQGYNGRLGLTPGFLAIDWTLFKAILWTESGGPNSAAWSTRPMQIGNPGDPAYAVLKGRREGADLVMSLQLQNEIAGNINDPKLNVRAGIAYLYVRLARSDIQSVWDATDTNTKEYSVVAGDTLESISKKVGSTVSALQLLNPGVNVLHPKQKLKFRKASMRRVLTGWLPATTTTVAQRYNVGDPDYAAKLNYCLSTMKKLKR
ncbi:MAG TPA: LysM domain-containing protein, partial [Polyangiaceae bacterium]|nr:LysM domain-containing protein [Polyangiaceae bacterium]